MSENNKTNDDNPVLENPPKQFSTLITQLKSSKRDEFLGKLSSLVAIAYREGRRTSKEVRERQRWFTICGYLAQVAARVVTDLEYERLRADVDEMKRRIQETYVIRPRRTTYSAGARSMGKISRKPNT